ncbi:MAG: TatD family hydrolase [Deltaproteobacteria bacterium]|nr:TatD family hydrolase [Deltaproteobacteria bacterium]
MGGFDAHTHLDLMGEPAAAMARALAAGVSGVAIAGADPVRWPEVLRVGAAVGAVVTLGLHPWFVDAGWEVAVAALPRPTGGVGEIGLDWRRAGDDHVRAHQIAAFRAQLALAREAEVPVCLHLVGAVDEGLAIAAGDGLPRPGGLVHGWSGGPGRVARAVGLGLHLSFGPRELRTRAGRASLRVSPPSRLLLETDAPEVRVDGRAAEPADLRRVAEAAGPLIGLAPEALLRRAGDEARRLFLVQS